MQPFEQDERLLVQEGRRFLIATIFSLGSLSLIARPGDFWYSLLEAFVALCLLGFVFLVLRPAGLVKAVAGTLAAFIYSFTLLWLKQSGRLEGLDAWLRKRADVDPGFDALLDEFLEKRNILVHRLADVPGWSLESGSGLAAANAFVQDMLRVTEAVLNVFVGLVRAWQDQTGIGTPEFGSDPFFAEIDSTYKPLVNDIFFRKSDQT